MKVALAHGEIGPWDGSSRYIVDVAAMFAANGHEVSLFCERCSRQLPEGIVPRPLSGLQPGERFDLLYGSDLDLLPALAERATRFFYAPLDVLAASPERERWALQRCERVLRFTHRAVQLLERTYGLLLQHKSLVAVYVSQEYERHAAPRFRRPRPAQLLWVGRLIPSKNVGFLIRSAALLMSNDWRLVIVGDGSERAALREQSDDLDLGDQVEFCGHEADLSGRFDSASMFLTASLQEHYSLTVMEAYSRGLPCLGLAPDDGQVFNACDEQILNGVTGYVVSDESDLAWRIDELLEDEDTRLGMAQLGWQRKRDKFTSEHFWAALQAAL